MLPATGSVGTGVADGVTPCGSVGEPFVIVGDGVADGDDFDVVVVVGLGLSSSRHS